MTNRESLRSCLWIPPALKTLSSQMQLRVNLPIWSAKFRFMSSSKAGSNRLTVSASALLFIESALVLALAIYMIALGFTHDKEWAPYLGVIAFAVAGSAGLYALARGVKAGKRWANSPAILANLIALGVAKYQFEAGLYWLAIPIAVMAIAVVVGLFLIIKDSQR